MYAAQGLFSAAQGERHFVQKEGRNIQVSEHSSSISDADWEKTGKKRVFRDADFFEISRKYGFILGGAP